MVERIKATERRAVLKDALLAAAQHTIESEGLRGLRARKLAEDVGCALGAIYNVFADLDELILTVNSRTLAALEHELKSAGRTARESRLGPERAIEQLVVQAVTYLDFAATRKQRWRALFEHRLPEGAIIPDWYLNEQQHLFAYVEEPLRDLLADATLERRAMLARSLFSAVHGLVALGLEEKLLPIPLPTLHEQVAIMVSAFGRGIAGANES